MTAEISPIPFPQVQPPTNPLYGGWFDNFIADLREIQNLLDSDKADEKTLEVFHTLMLGEKDDVAKLNRNMTQTYFVKKIIADYLANAKSNHVSKLAFTYNDSEVLVWAELQNDDWETEKALILAEARVNAKYHPFGFDMVSTFVETRDELPIPNHYRTIKN